MIDQQVVCQPARDRLRPAPPVDTVGGDGKVERRDPVPRRLDSPDDDEPEHDTVIMAW